MNPVLLGPVFTHYISLYDVGNGCDLFDGGDQLGVLHESLGQGFDLGRKRRGEEESLSLLWSVIEDIRNIIDESHVEHPVRFIENDIIDPTESDLSASKKIEDTSRCSNNHLGATS